MVEGRPNEKLISTIYVESSNLTGCMGNRRFTRLPNAFSKWVEKHHAMLSLFFTHYNLCRIHEAICVTQAMEVGIDDAVRDCEWIVAHTPKREPESPTRSGPCGLKVQTDTRLGPLSH